MERDDLPNINEKFHKTQWISVTDLSLKQFGSHLLACQRARQIPRFLGGKYLRRQPRDLADQVEHPRDFGGHPAGDIHGR